MKDLARKALGWMGMAAVFVATLEVAARLDDRISKGAPLTGPYDAQSMLITRDSLGIKGRPFGRFEKWSLNSLGFRGPEPAVPKPPGTVRIVALGASETFGLYETEKQHWPAQLRRHLEAAFPGRPVELVNASIVGLTVSSLEQYYRHRVELVEPDLVLLYPHFIDYIAGNGPGGRKARVAQRAASAAKAEESAGGLLGLGPLRFPAKLKLAAKTKGPRPLREAYARHALEKSLAAIDTARQSDAYDAGELARFDSLLTAFATYVEGKGVDLILSDYACAFALGPREETLEGLENLWRVYPWMSREALVEGLAVFNHRVAEIAARTGVLHVSQASLLEGWKSNWVADGIHFTDAGAGAAARNWNPVVEGWVRKRLAAREAVVQEEPQPRRP